MDLQALRREMDALAAPVPGCQVVVWSDAEMWSYAGGILDAGSDAPVTAESRFPVASLTKVWLCALATILAADEGVSPDEPLVDVFPGAAFTLRQLLGHTAGFPTRLELAARTPKEWVDTAIEHGCVGRPGEYFCYSNAGMIAVAASVEEFSGLAWADAVQDYLAAPLGVTVGSALDKDHPSVRGHLGLAEGWLPVGLPLKPGPESAAGSLATSASALAALGRAMVHGTGPFDIDATYQTLLVEEQAARQPLVSRGLDPGTTGGGLIPDMRRPGVQVALGSMDGIEAALRVDVEAGTVVAMTTNGDAGAEVWRRLLEVLDPVAPTIPSPAFDAAQVSPHPPGIHGRYVDGSDVVDLVQVGHDTLVHINDVQVARLLWAPDHFLVVHPSRGCLGRGRYVPGAEEDIIHLGSRLVRRTR